MIKSIKIIFLGVFLCLGYITQAQSPGGVNTNLQLWLKANQGWSASTWTDQSTNAFNVSALGSAQSTNNSTLVNFNPVITFPNAINYFQIPTSATNFANLNVSTTAAQTQTFVAGKNTTTTNSGYGNVFSKNNGSSWDGINMAAYLNTNRFWGYNSSNWTGTGSSESAQVNLSTDPNTINIFNGSNTLISGTNTNRLSLNGATAVTNNTAFVNPNTFPLVIGSDASLSGGYYMQGIIGEVIYYNSNLTTDQQQRVNSYLAIKYGVQLDPSLNYLSSKSTSSSTGVVWNVTTNSGYNNNVFGIGRDNGSALVQKQSNSVNSGSQPIIGQGSSLANSNTANANSFTASDTSFVMAGSDNGAASFATSISGISGINNRLTRIWKVQRTNHSDTVVIAWPTSNTTAKLLISTDNVFNSSDLVISTTTVVINGTSYQMAKVSAAQLANGSFFTFGALVTAPGGVVLGLKLWLKADAGVSPNTDGGTVTAWNDQSGNAYHFTSIAGTAPKVYTTTTSNLINYNPSLKFLGNGGIYNNNPIFTQTSPYTFGGVVIDEKTASGTYGCVFQGASDFYFTLHKQNGSTGTNGWNAYRNANYYLNEGNASSTNIIGGNGFSPSGGSNGAWNGTNFSANIGTQPQAFVLKDGNTTGTTQTNFIDGYKTTSTGLNNANRTVSWFQKTSLGAYNTNEFQGTERIPEFFAYNQNLSDVDVQKINSYLAIKYGITLGQGGLNASTNINRNHNSYNYLASNGTVVWTGSTATYNADIFGIALDNSSALYQKQSNSVNSGSQPIIGQGSSLANSNTANTNSFTASDMSFVMAGSDNGAATFTTSISGITGINNRLTRIWKVQRTNHSDTVVIAWPTSNTTAMLLVSTDNVFNSSDIAISTTTAIINGRSYQMARVSASQLTDGSFFTFGAYVTMPGGVSGALIWTRADLGTNTTTNLGNVSSWVNNGSGEGTFTTLGTTANPKFTTNFVNFNPAVGYYSTCGGCGLKNAGVNAAGNGGNMLLTSYAVNIRDAWPYGYVPTITFPNATGSFINENYAGLANLDATRWYLYAHGPSANLITVPTQIANKPYISSLNFPAIGQTVYTTQNGTLSNSSSNVTSDYWVGRDANLFAEGRSIGSGAGYHLSYGHMTEVIAFIKTLSSTERNQLESYLAIKYGVTLLNDLGTSTRNYLSPWGSNIWNASVSSSFSNNVFGVGRDDLTALNQRVSNSVNTISAAKLIVASNNNYTWRNDTNARTTFTRDSVYQIYGDNNNNSTTLIDLDTNSCPALKGNSKRIAKKWRVQTTGIQDATWIRADLTSYSNFSSSFMLIADDSNFTINAAIVPTNSYSSGIAVVNYRFPTNSVKFISFGGVPGTPACTQCVGGKGIIKSSSWSGAATANVKLNVNAGNPTSGAITANLRAFTGNTGVEWINSRTPSPYGAWTWLERWDVGTQTVPYTVKLSQAVTADFQVSGINSYWGKSDIVRVIGFCGNTQVVPTVTRDNKSFSTYNLSGNTATGSSCCYEGYSYSTINVSFKNQVDSIRIEWTAQNPPTFQTWSWLYIGDMSLGCANPIEPNPDNMYVTQSFITDTLETCRVAKLKINVKNMNCSSKQISLWNTLPSGIQYLDTTYLDLDALTGSKQPTITSSSFRLDSLTVRSGESSFYINVKSTSNATADYAFQSRYRVVSAGHTGDTILSDDASGQSGLQTTKLRYVASSSISPLPTMVYSADKSCFDNRGDTITYKVTYNNTSGSSIANVDFTNHLSGGQKYVSGSLNKGSLGGTNDLLDTFHIIISNMTLPVGTSTITYKVFTDSVTKRIENNGIIAIDRTSPCGSDNQVNSNILGIDSAFYYSGLTTGSPKASDIGITTLDRNLNSNWPKGLPNAWVTLHSRTKGFVITRTTSTAITTPIEGMLIYDTTDKCMKLYNGTIWKCIERQCAE